MPRQLSAIAYLSVLAIFTAACSTMLVTQPSGAEPVRADAVMKDAVTLWTERNLGQYVDGQDDDVDLFLKFRSIRPMPGLDASKAENRGNIFVRLSRRDGKFQADHLASADYNQRSRDTAVEIIKAEIDSERDRFTGELKVTIGPDFPRPGGPAGFPKQPDVYHLTFDTQINRGTAMPYQIDHATHTPPWRKDTPVYGGDLISGTYTSKRGDHEQDGEVVGARSPAIIAGQWGTRGNSHLAIRNDGSVKFTFNLADRRVSWGSYGSATLTFKDPISINPSNPDPAMAQRLRGVVFERDEWTGEEPPRVRVRTDKGWSPYATVQTRDEGLIMVEPWQDELISEATQIEAIEVSCGSNLGVGSVSLVIRSVSVLADAPQQRAAYAEMLARKAAKPVIGITVDPETRVSINGTSEIPKGIFGFHDVGHDKPRQPDSKKLDPVEYMAYLNPGYLRPLTHVGFGAKPLTDDTIAERLKNRSADEPDNIFYQRAKAGNAIDNVIWTHTTDLWNRPPWMDQGVERAAAGVEAFYRDLASRSWHPDAPDAEFNVLRKLEVWNEPFMWGRHINMKFQQPANQRRWEDPTQPGYLPAKVGTDAYIELFKAAVRGAKSANPHVQIGGPSSASFDGDDWGSFDYHTRPFLDACHDIVDFITEHHYGGKPETFALTYAVVQAYTETNFDKTIPIYNTEANHLGARDAVRADYNIRDMLASIRERDVVKGRALHATWNGYVRDLGEEHTYRFLADLRGDVIHTTSTSDQHELHVVASHPEPGQMALMIYSPEAATFEIAGLDQFSEIQLRYILSSGDGQAADIRDPEGQPLQLPDGGSTTLIERDRQKLTLKDGRYQIDLPARSGVRLMLFREGFAPQKEIRQTEHFFPIYRQEITLDTPRELDLSDLPVNRWSNRTAMLHVMMDRPAVGIEIVPAAGATAVGSTGGDREAGYLTQQIQLAPGTKPKLALTGERGLVLAAWLSWDEPPVAIPED